jgi:Uma2 family endonuclease
MKWQEVCEHPSLRNLPFKIETDEHGDLIMSLAKIRHGFLQGRIGALLAQLRNDGEVIQECAIATTEGTKVADVAWVTRSRFVEIVDDYEAHIAPEVCVEVLSRPHTGDEIDTKKTLYFERGAVEVWICDQQGQLQFFDRQGERDTSALFPAMPKVVGETEHL